VRRLRDRTGEHRRLRCTEQSYFPTYTCSNTGTNITDWTWDTVFQTDLGSSVSEFDLRGFQYDGGGGDSSWLFRLNMWVR